MSPAIAIVALFGCVVLPEKLPHVIELRGLDVGVRSDDVAVVRMPLRKQRLEHRFLDDAVRPVLAALTPLVPHDVLLVRQLRLIDRLEQVSHAIGLEPERQLELIRRHRLEVVGAIEAGRAVDARGAAAGEQLEVRVALDVLRALEHHVLEQMREARAAGRLVRGTDVIPDVDADERHAMVFGEDHFEPVGERVLFDVELRNVARRRLRAQRQHAHSHHQQQRECFLHDFLLSTFDFRLFTFYFYLFSRLAHKYQDATDRYGRHRSAIACNRLTSGVFRRL